MEKASLHFYSPQYEKDLDEIYSHVRLERDAAELLGKNKNLLIYIKDLSEEKGRLIREFTLYLHGDILYEGKVNGLKEMIICGNVNVFKGLSERLKKNIITKSEGEEIGEYIYNYLRPADIIPLPTGILDPSKGTLIMGILNITPDSFSDGGKYLEPEAAIDRAFEMVEEGADIIDIGGESTRPGSEGVSAEIELKRVMPVIKGLSKRIKVPISIDTTKSEVAERAIGEGVQIINDISAMRADCNMINVAVKYGVAVILMHMRGTPKTMQLDTSYRALRREIFDFLKERIKWAEEHGIDRRRIIIDPGIGFGKSVEGNLEIMRNLEELRFLGKPILIGTSRKSFIGKVLDLGVDERMEGSAATVAVSIMKGANIIRVHDVLRMKRVARMVDAIIRGFKERSQ